MSRRRCKCCKCNKCSDHKRPVYLLLNLANFADVTFYLATECDPITHMDVDGSKSCQVVYPTSAFNGAHQVDWVSTTKIGATCVHIYETTGEHSLGDFYKSTAPYVCQDGNPPMSQESDWLRGLKYRFRVTVVEKSDNTTTDVTVQGISADGSLSGAVVNPVNVARTWFCGSGTTAALKTFGAGFTRPIGPLFNDDGTYYASVPDIFVGSYTTNEQDAACGGSLGSATITIESSTGRAA